MADSFHSLNYHFIWSTKDRHPWLTTDIERRVWDYLAGIAHKKCITPLCIGGWRDHVHALVRLPPNLDVSKAVQLLKGPSSKWASETLPGFGGFQWQDGYGAFTVSRSAIPGVGEYIKGQEQHHRKKSFKEEFLDYLEKHEIDYKPEYLWG